MSEHSKNTSNLVPSPAVDEGLAAQALRVFFQKMAGNAPFGSQAAHDRAANVVAQHTQGDRAATLFLEYPLMGDGGFDVHVYPVLNHAELRERHNEARESFAKESQASFLESSFLESSFPQWCSTYPERMVEGGFAYDLSRCPNVVPEPCLYAAFFTADKSAVPQSFEAMGASQFAGAFEKINAALDKNHRVYYTGVMHGREPLVAHIGYKAHGALRSSYRSHPELLFRHAQQLGFDFPDVAREAEAFTPFARLGFAHDIQYAFDESGIVANTLAFSFVPGCSPDQNKKSLCEGNLNRALTYLQQDVQIADDRWRFLEPVLGSWMIPCCVNGAVRLATMRVTVGYLKIHWGQDGADCAKLYVSLYVAPIG